MEIIQPPQNGTVTETTTSSGVKQTYSKELFPTPLRCFEMEMSQEFIDSILKVYNDNNTDSTIDIMTLESEVVESLKSTVYDVCQQLSEFELVPDSDANKLPQIQGSIMFFQQPMEHVPLHAFEFTPLVLTFVLNTGSTPPFTYYADSRGAVQTQRHLVSQNLVGTSFGLKARTGEIIVTPGYLQRYVETNLSDQSQVFLNVLVGFTNY